MSNKISDVSLISMIHILKMEIEVKLVKDVHSKISQTMATECFQFTNFIFYNHLSNMCWSTTLKDINA